MADICYECGRSVKLGSGRFVNRIPSLDTPEERRANGFPFPDGDWLCEQCDIAADNDAGCLHNYQDGICKTCGYTA